MVSNDLVVKIMEKYDCSRQNILYILHELQEMDAENCIREEYANVIKEKMGVKPSEVYDIITFHSMFNEEPKGKYIIEICNSGPCFIRKGKAVVECLEEILGVKVGQTTQDGLFTIKYTSCIGACDVAPAFKIGDKIYGNLDNEKIEAIVKELRGGTSWKN